VVLSSSESVSRSPGRRPLSDSGLSVLTDLVVVLMGLA